jgi:hypothetical protein
MKRLLILAAVSAAALASSACVTVIDADSDYGWTGNGARSFDSAREDCRARAGHDEGTTAFVTCMDEQGWTRNRD